MKPRRTLQLVLGISLAILIFFTGIFYQTVLGVSRCKFTRWEEERFINQSLSLLRSTLDAKHVHLLSYEADALLAHTGRQLKTGQRVMIFAKGESYSWFMLGTAVNVGYVIVFNGPQGETVSEIIKGYQVDSL